MSRKLHILLVNVEIYQAELTKVILGCHSQIIPSCYLPLKDTFPMPPPLKGL